MSAALDSAHDHCEFRVMITALHHDLKPSRDAARMVVRAVLLGLLLIPPSVRDGAVST
jgi:hypothetical protein